MTVASMPMVSPVGRDTPREDTSTPRTMLPPPMTTAISTPSCLRSDQVAGDAVDGRLVDAEGLAAGEIFAGELDHHATIDRLSHCAIAFLPGAGAPGANAPEAPSARLLLAAGGRDFGGEIGFLLARFPRREHSAQNP